MDPRYSQLSEIEALRLIAASAARQYPEQLLWACFPQAGGFEPLPSGETVVDLLTGRVLSPDKSRVLSGDIGILRHLQSVLLIVDAPMTVRFEPGVGAFFTTVGVVVAAPARQLERIRFTAPSPFNLLLVAGTGPEPLRVTPLMLGQLRLADATLTKVAAAGTADDWTDLTFVPYWDTTILPTKWGQSYILGGPFGRRSLQCRNLSTVTNAELRFLGAKTLAQASALEALGLGAIAWQLDPDIHTGGSATFVALSALTASDQESNRMWTAFKVQGRVAAAAATAATARVIIEHIGSTPDTGLS